MSEGCIAARIVRQVRQKSPPLDQKIKKEKCQTGAQEKRPAMDAPAGAAGQPANETAWHRLAGQFFPKPVKGTGKACRTRLRRTAPNSSWTQIGTSRRLVQRSTAPETRTRYPTSAREPSAEP